MGPAVALSRKDGRHSAVALLLKAALIQVSDYRLLGASGSGVHVARNFALCVCFVDLCLSFCIFSLGHCVVCSSSLCGF